MENIPFKLDFKTIKSDISEKSKNNLDTKNFMRNSYLSKSQRDKDFNRFYPNNKKDFLKNKRKNKNKIKNEVPDTPHNTGQYLCHIYQANESKDLKKQKENENNDLGINFFEDNDDDIDDFFDDDYKINEDPKRERLMSMEGKDMENFLMQPEDINDGKKIFKSAVMLDEPKIHLNLDFEQMKESQIIEEK